MPERLPDPPDQEVPDFTVKEMVTMQLPLEQELVQVVVIPVILLFPEQEGIVVPLLLSELIQILPEDQDIQAERVAIVLVGQQEALLVEHEAGLIMVHLLSEEQEDHLVIVHQ